MTGFFGGTRTGDSLDTMRRTVDGEPWFESELFEDRSLGLGVVHHGDRDPGGHATWEDGHRAGVLYGAVANLQRLPFDTAGLFERVLDDPSKTLSRLEGPFALACYDAGADRFVLATDKIGSRSIYYTTRNGFSFGSQLKAVLAGYDDPRIDGQAVSDMLMMGSVWGERTLVDGVRALPPKTLLEYDDGEVRTRRYWSLSFEEAEPGDQYMFELASRYRSAVRDMASTLQGDVGLWLSGGLDSRTMAAELARARDDVAEFDLGTYTYDANPKGPNPELGARVANALGLPNKPVPLGPDRALDYIQSAVDATDGMCRWSSFINLSSVYNVPDSLDVMLEAAGQGEFLGEHVTRYQLRRPSAVEGIYAGQATTPAEEVSDLMSVGVDPLESFKETVRRSDETTKRGKILDAHFSHHYSRFVYSSNPLARAQVGTRVPFANGDFLSHVAKLPTTYRMGTVPFTNGSIPYGASKPKLKLVRAIHDGLAEIPYERTRLPPKYPYPAHVAGFVLGNGYDMLRSDSGHGGTSMTGTWYRDNRALRTYVDDLLEDACDRPFFDGDRIRDVQQEHLRGEADHIAKISPITTLEIWFQMQLDGGATLADPTPSTRGGRRVLPQD